MNRMPGFTADLSVSAPHHSYPVKTVALSAGMNLVEGQLWLRGGVGTCIPNCICVGPDECPCCTADEIWGRGPRLPRWFVM